MAGQSRSTLIDVDASGFLADVEAAFGQMRSRSGGGVRRLAIDVQNRARQLAPVDTGRLRSSIGNSEGRDDEGFYVEVGTDVDYATYVEFGTSTHQAQPFVRPAFAEVSGGKFETVVGKAINGESL